MRTNGSRTRLNGFKSGSLFGFVSFVHTSVSNAISARPIVELYPAKERSRVAGGGKEGEGE